MYNPPISIIEEIFQSRSIQLENDVMSVVKSYGINVNKNELIAALNHDRNQYDKGYADGIREFAIRFIEYVDVVYSKLPVEICGSDLNVKSMVENFVKEIVGEG